MKKTLAFLLAVVLCFFSVACAANTENEQDGTEQGASQTPFDEQSVVSEFSETMSAADKLDALPAACIGFLQVKINPEFELYVAMDEAIGEIVVLGARPINADAKSLFETLSFSGSTLWTVLFGICDAARSEGFLEDGGTIKIDYYASAGKEQPVDLLHDAENILTAYQEEKSVAFTCTSTYTAVGEQPDDSNAEDVYDLIERDANGNIIKTVLVNDEENTVETHCYDAAGNLISAVFENKTIGQTHEKYYASGALTKEVVSEAWGTRTETFDASGKVLSRIVDNREENAYTESYWTYFTDGTVSSLIEKLTNDYYTQGYYKEEQYYQGGAVAVSHVASQFEDNKYYYDEGGNTTRYEGKNSAGERVVIVYNADGSHEDTIYEASGKVRVETWDANGNLTVTYLP